MIDVLRPILHFEKKNENFNNKIENTKSYNPENYKNESSIIVYDTNEYIYTELKKYKFKDILSIINNSHKDKFVFIQINNDEPLQEFIVKSLTKKFFDKERKKSQNINKLDLDYALEIDNNILCLNMSILSDLTFQDLEKYVIQLYFFENSVILFNKSGNKEIFDTIIKEFKFKEKNINIFVEKNFKSSTDLKKKGIIFLNQDIFKSPDSYFKNRNLRYIYTPISAAPISESNSDFLNIRKRKFTIDSLLYYLISITIEKLNNFTTDVQEDAQSLKEIYMEISEKERKDFFRRLECIEIFTVLIRNEAFCKRNFIEYVKKNYFSRMGEDKKYFGKNSFFLLELLIAKTKQIDIKFNQIKFKTNMVKENYNIILEDNLKKNKDRLNQITKIISLMSVFFMPFTVISSIFGMNIKIPFMEWDSVIPFFIILSLSISIFCVHIYVFKKYNFI